MDTRIGTQSTEKFALLDALRFPTKPRLDQQLAMLMYSASTLELDAAAFSSALGKDFTADIVGHNVIAIGLGGIHAASNIVTAMSLISNQVYHPQKTAMIVLNLLSGINLFAFTDSLHTGPFFGISQMGAGTTMAAPAFAFAMLCDFSAAAIDLYYSTEQGYFERMLGEAEFNHQKLQRMEDKYFNGKPPQHLLDDHLYSDIYTTDYVNEPNYQIYKNAYEALLKKQELLLFNIECQLNYYDSRDSETDGLAIIPPMVRSGQERIKNILECHTDRYSNYTQTRYTISDSFVEQHEAIEATRQKLHRHNKWKLAVKAASFGGMLLQAMPTIFLLASATLAVPYLNLISLCIITLVALVYLYQLHHRNQISGTMEEADPALPEIVTVAYQQDDQRIEPSPITSPPGSPNTQPAVFDFRPGKYKESRPSAIDTTQKTEKKTPPTPPTPPSSPTPTTPTMPSKTRQKGDNQMWRRQQKKRVPPTVHENHEGSSYRPDSMDDNFTEKQPRIRYMRKTTSIESL